MQNHSLQKQLSNALSSLRSVFGILHQAVGNMRNSADTIEAELSKAEAVEPEVRVLQLALALPADQRFLNTPIGKKLLVSVCDMLQEHFWELMLRIFNRNGRILNASSDSGDYQAVMFYLLDILLHVFGVQVAPTCRRQFLTPNPVVPINDLVRKILFGCMIERSARLSRNLFPLHLLNTFLRRWNQHMLGFPFMCPLPLEDGLGLGSEATRVFPLPDNPVVCDYSVQPRADDLLVVFREVNAFQGTAQPARAPFMCPNPPTENLASSSSSTHSESSHLSNNNHQPEQK